MSTARLAVAGKPSPLGQATRSPLPWKGEAVGTIELAGREHVGAAICGSRTRRTAHTLRSPRDSRQDETAPANATREIRATHYH